MRTQKSRSPLLRTKSSKFPPLKPGVGQNITMHASLTAKNFFLSNFSLPGLFTFFFLSFFSFFFLSFFLFFPQNVSRVSSVLVVAKAGCCVGPNGITGHPAHRYRQLMQVPLLEARGTRINRLQNMRVSSAGGTIISGSGRDG